MVLLELIVHLARSGAINGKEFAQRLRTLADRLEADGKGTGGQVDSRREMMVAIPRNMATSMEIAEKDRGG